MYLINSDKERRRKAEERSIRRCLVIIEGDRVGHRVGQDEDALFAKCKYKVETVFLFPLVRPTVDCIAPTEGRPCRRTKVPPL